MRIFPRFALSATLAAGLGTASFSTASAQYYYPPCSPFPLAWPFCAVGAIVGTAATIATAPFWVFNGASPYYYRYPQPVYYYPPPYAPGYYPPPR